MSDCVLRIIQVFKHVFWVLKKTFLMRLYKCFCMFHLSISVPGQGARGAIAGRGRCSIIGSRSYLLGHNNILQGMTGRPPGCQCHCRSLEHISMVLGCLLDKTCPGGRNKLLVLVLIVPQGNSSPQSTVRSLQLSLEIDNSNLKCKYYNQ